MNIIKISLSFCLVFLFGCASIPAPTHVGAEASLQAKRVLPFCTPDTSLYEKLLKLGERPFGAGIENSKLARQQKGLSLGFAFDPSTSHWSFLTTNGRQKTCFVAMGKNWRVVKESAQDKVFKTDLKQVGYSAPFAKVKRELLKEGKTLAGFDEQDLDFSGTNVLRETTYLFMDSSGSFTVVTSILYKYGNGVPFEISSIDSVGSHWVWTSSEFSHNAHSW